MKCVWPLQLSFCFLLGHVVGQDIGVGRGQGGPLHQASFDGDLEKIEELLGENKEELNATDQLGRTPLHYAAAAGQEKAAKLLIAKGADVNATFSYSFKELDRSNHCYEDYLEFSGTSAPPVVTAASSGQLEMVELLTAHGAKLTAEQVNEFELLHNVADVAMAKLFIRLGADVNGRDKHGATPLNHAAIWKERHEIVGLLLEAGADLNIAGKYETPLTAAARMGHTDLVKSFLKQGADPNVMGESFSASPLTASARYGKTEMIKLLLKAGADPNKQPKNAGTPLHFAADSGDVEAAKVLLAAGAKFEAKTPCRRRTPLQTAAWSGQAEVAELLLDEGAEIEATDAGGLTALHIAGIEGSASVVEALLKRGAKVNAVTAQGVAPLQVTVSRAILLPDDPFFSQRQTSEISARHMKIIHLLAKAGADLNAGRSGGNTPLIRAINECTVKTQELPITLIQLGADVMIPGLNGATPLQLAENKKLDRVVELIKATIEGDE
jgi:ankyrin repeat protein